MRVIPERAGVGQVELVDEAAARTYGFLRDAWDAVHRVRKPNSMPMYCGLNRKRVLDLDAQALALLEAELRPRDGAVVRPHRRIGVTGTDERLAPRAKRQLSNRCGADAWRESQRGQGEELPSVHRPA